MRVMTWNIQNGGTISFHHPDIANIQEILSVIRQEAPDVIVLQEYQSEYHEQLVTNGLEKMRYICTVCQDAPDRTLRNRVLIGSKLPFEEMDRPADILAYSRRNWNEIRIPDYPLTILGVDVPLAQTTGFNGCKKDNTREKRIFLKALENKFREYQTCTTPAVILGDFNLHAGASYHEFLERFPSYLKEITTQESTWGQYKLDYIFANDAFLHLLDQEKEYAPIATKFSDHKYLYVDLK